MSDAHHRLMPPTLGAGHNNIMNHTEQSCPSTTGSRDRLVQYYLDDSKVDPPLRKVSSLQLDGLKEACNRVPPRAISERRAADACYLCCVARPPASQFYANPVPFWASQDTLEGHSVERIQTLGRLFSVAGYDSVDSMYRPMHVNLIDSSTRHLCAEVYAFCDTTGRCVYVAS